MFKMGLIVIGYTIVIVVITTIVCKLIERSKLDRLKEELKQANFLLSSAKTEIKSIDLALEEQSKK